MASDDSLHFLENRRRRALWILAHLDPGDPRALCVLRVLDEIDQQERPSLGSLRILSVEEISNQVTAEPHPIGTSIVRDDAIPEPWREGGYLHDWLKFLSKWQQEMTHLERHRAARDRKG